MVAGDLLRALPDQRRPDGPAWTWSPVVEQPTRSSAPAAQPAAVASAGNPAQPPLVPAGLQSPELPPPVGSDNLYAVASTNGQSFTLYSSKEELGTYDLPVYRDASGRIKQVLLTPPAVLADLTMVGGCLFLAAWAAGGLGWIH